MISDAHENLAKFVLSSSILLSRPVLVRPELNRISELGYILDKWHAYLDQLSLSGSQEISQETGISVEFQNEDSFHLCEYHQSSVTEQDWNRIHSTNAGWANPCELRHDIAGQGDVVQSTF